MSAMLGRQTNQTSLLDVETWFDTSLVDPDSIYGLMARWGSRLIQDEDFIGLYSHTGRPSVSPALMSKVLLLMYVENIPDREAEQRARFDLRWKIALQIPMNEPGFDYSSLCRFRARLATNQQEKLVFEKFVKLAKEIGIVKDNTVQIVDSTHVLGAGAVQSTFSLIKEAIRKLFKTFAKKGSNAKSLNELSLLLDYKEKGKEKIDWKNPEARKELLNKLVTDSRTILEAIKDTELNQEEQAAVELLSKVTEQDIEETSDNEVAIKKEVAKDRTISVNDPEMRHGHKTTTGKFNGHKAQIMVDEASEVITNIGITPGNQADGEVIDELLETTIVSPGTLIGDTAYGTMNARETAKKYDIAKVVAPLPRGGKKKTDKFSKYDFEIDFKNNICTCPAKVTSTHTYKDKDGNITTYQFNKQTCNKCPLREQCTKHGKGRRVSIKSDEEVRRSIINEIETEEFKIQYRRRPIVERKAAHLVRHGIRKARYFGKTKTLIQTAFIAAVVNLKRIFKIVSEGQLCNFEKLQQALGPV